MRTKKSTTLVVKNKSAEFEATEMLVMPSKTSRHGGAAEASSRDGPTNQEHSTFYNCVKSMYISTHILYQILLVTLETTTLVVGHDALPFAPSWRSLSES